MANDVGKPIVTTDDGTPLMAIDNQLKTDELSFKLDRDWGKNAFLVSDSFLEDQSDVDNRYWSTADAKFTDTRMGGNIGINPKPQFTRYADVRTPGRVPSRNQVSPTNFAGNYGMGRYYSEAIDDPEQTIFVRFGMEQFNSLTTFLSRCFDADSLALARTGRATSLFYSAGKLAGTITVVVAFPAVAALVAGFKVLDWVFSRPTSKFYTFKPTMHLYWSTINSLVNNFSVNKGLFPKVMQQDASIGQRLGTPYQLDQDQMNALSQLMPDVFPNSGGEAKNYWDVYALANRGQRAANAAFMQDYNKLQNGSASDYTGYLKRELSGDGTHRTYISNSSSEPTFVSYLNKILQFSYYMSDDNNPRMEQDPRVDADSKDPNKKKDPSFFQSFLQNFDAEFRDGSQFAIFKVDHTGSVGESFSNAFAESQISQTLNTKASEMREATFAFANGNLIGGAAGEALGAVTGAVKDFALGALDGVTMGFSSLIPGLASGALIDIPKHWQSSTAELPRMQYTIKLRSQYGNVISQMMNIWIPFFMWFGAALPLATGKQGYTRPFLCQIFDRGRCQSKLGAIENISITRGTSHLPFDMKGNALAVDLTVTIVELSSIMTMPISTGSLFSQDAALDEDNILSDYLAVLAGQDLYTQMYAMPKAKLRLAKSISSLTKLQSPAYWANIMHESATSGMLKYLTLGTGVLLEGLVRQPEASVGSIQ